MYAWRTPKRVSVSDPDWDAQHPEQSERRTLALLCHLYAIKPWEIDQLTERQLDALIGESRWILYMRDRPMRDYMFMKLDKEQLADDSVKDVDSVTKKAQRRFLAMYNLPEFEVSRMTRLAAADINSAIRKKDIPHWVLNLIDLQEIEDLTK